MDAVALRLAYDGTAFDSYARQPARRTVEGALLEALRHEGLEEGSFRTGSRTDAGVSALENVVAARLARPHVRGLVPALQRHLPPGLWVTGAAAAPPGFDPRRAAWRQYRYLAPAAGEDLPALRAAAARFVGTWRMDAFSRLEAGRDPVRTVLAVRVARTATAGPAWSITVRGESFLWNQVRRMVDAILAVGRGEATADDVSTALRSGRPHRRFGVAPAEGLVLERVRYPALRWDPAAGRPDARTVRPAVVEAATRMIVARGILRQSRGATR